MNLVSKTEIMQRVVAGRSHECFQHSDEGFFDITLMREWAIANKKWVLVLLSDIVPHILETRDIDESRIAELDEKSWKTDPGLAVIYDRPGQAIEHLMIDGHHRALRRQREGLEVMKFYMIPEAAIIRPHPGMILNPHFDWGKIIKDGKLVDRDEV